MNKEPYSEVLRASAKDCRYSHDVCDQDLADLLDKIADKFAQLEAENERLREAIWTVTCDDEDCSHRKADLLEGGQ